MVVIGTLALFSLMGGTARYAHADSTTEAEDHVKRGVALRRAGNDVAALREFQKAWDITQTPRTSAQLGLCQQSLGQWAPAQARLLEALAAKEDPWITKNRMALEKALASAREHIGHLSVVGDPKGAEVLIGGRVVGTFPLSDPIAVSEGTVDVEVRAGKFQSVTRSAKVDAGQFVELVVRLTPQNSGEGGLAAAPTFNPAVAASSEASKGDLAVNGSEHPDSGATSTPIYRSPWFWIATGVVVVGAVVVGVLASSGGGTTYPSVDKTGKGF